MKNKTKNNGFLKKVGIGFGCLTALASSAFADTVGFGITPGGEKYLIYEVTSNAWNATRDVYGLSNTKENEREIDRKHREMQIFMDDISYDEHGNIQYHIKDGLIEFDKGTKLRYRYEWTDQEKENLEKRLKGRVDGTISQESKEKISNDIYLILYGTPKEKAKSQLKSQLRLNLFGSEDYAGIGLDYRFKSKKPVKFIVGLDAFYQHDGLEKSLNEELISQNEFPNGSSGEIYEIKDKEEKCDFGFLGKIKAEIGKFGVSLKSGFKKTYTDIITTEGGRLYDSDGNLIENAYDLPEKSNKKECKPIYGASLDFDLFKGFDVGVSYLGDFNEDNNYLINFGIDLNSGK